MRIDAAGVTDMFRTALIISACLLAAATAAAETTVFELPAELGTRTHQLPLSGVIIDVANLGLDCEAEYALFRCARGGTLFWELGYWSVRLDMQIADWSTMATWRPLEGAHSQSFDLVSAAQGGLPLDDGRITITLTALFDGVLTTPDINCELTNAGALGLVPILRLYLEYHDSLPVDGLRWGTLKALYF